MKHFQMLFLWRKSEIFIWMFHKRDFSLDAKLQLYNIYCFFMADEAQSDQSVPNKKYLIRLMTFLDSQESINQ